MSFYDTYKLKRVINASGTMTALGASRVSAEVIRAMADILPEFVEMSELQRAASRVIAWATGAEAGCVTACAASGVSIAVAACMTGDDFYKIESLPDTQGMRKEVIIQKGHAVNFGSSITQMIKITGSKSIEIGTATQCGVYQFNGAINEQTAAAIFVVSHHTVQNALIHLDEFIMAAHEKNIPVIVDAASEYDLKNFIAAGADLVLYSGHKFLGGPTSGLVAGKKPLVRACYFQEKGIGRGMKAGKESILGVMKALEQWPSRNADQIKQAEDEKLGYAYCYLQKIPALCVEYVQDPTGNPITRLKIAVDVSKSTLTAFEITRLLAQGNPAIKVRNHPVDRGYFFLDVCNLLDGEIEIICRRLWDLINNPVKIKYDTQNLADMEVRILSDWPD